jgi:hypothetical protein
MIRLFVYMPVFDSLWKSVGLGDEDQQELENKLLENTSSGAVIPGTGGLRKLRWKIPGKGKRGGVRVLYVDFPVYKQLHFVSLLKKNEKENLTSDDKTIIGKLIKKIEESLSKRSFKIEK